MDPPRSCLGRGRGGSQFHRHGRRQNGFDLELLQEVCNAVSVPVIASGGAGCIDHFTQLFQAIPTIDAGLAASIFHFGEVAIPNLKEELHKQGIPVRR